MVVKPGELMVCVAAREIKNTDVVFVGMRLPMLAFFLAKATHAPDAVGLFENGLMRDRPSEAPVVTMCDPPNVTGAMTLTSLREVMGYLQQGRVTLGFIGGAQVDRFGNLNTSRVGRKTSFRAAAAERIIALPGRQVDDHHETRAEDGSWTRWITSLRPDSARGRLARGPGTGGRRAGRHCHHLRRFQVRSRDQTRLSGPDPSRGRCGDGQTGDRIQADRGPGPGRDPTAHPG